MLVLRLSDFTICAIFYGTDCFSLSIVASYDIVIKNIKVKVTLNKDKILVILNSNNKRKEYKLC